MTESTPELLDRVMVIAAHPDDPEFGCAGTILKWSQAGKQITYVLLTSGDKGSHDPDMRPGRLAGLREDEQRAAAGELGVREVVFLRRPDGLLENTLDLRRELASVMRQRQPHIVLTIDPWRHYQLHPDHRAAGQAALDAVFPAAGNPAYFPELLAEGCQPHTPKEVWCSSTNQPSVVLDITETWPIKFQALLHHRSQIGDVGKFTTRMRSRHTDDSTDDQPRFEEKFRVIKYA